MPRTQAGWDQPALDLAASRLEAAGDALAALPVTYNFKVSRAEGPRLCRPRTHLVRGSVKLLHFNDATREEGEFLCARLNEATAARAVRNASFCELASMKVELLAPPHQKGKG